MKAAVETLSVFLQDVLAYIPPGLLPCVGAAFLEGGKYFPAFRHEFGGSILMICCTFSAGKWFFSESVRMTWTSHFLGVIVADAMANGPHVNPAVTVSMVCLDKCSYTEGYIRVAAQITGGLVAFPLFHAVSNALDWKPFGGPEFNRDEADDHATEPFLSEFAATFLLLLAIYALNFEINFGSYHYIIKQSLTALTIRALIEFFPMSGPAMNPMLATTWDTFGVGNTFEFPSEFTHYFVYWVAPCSAAVLASLVYVIYAGGTFMGSTLPIGPLKGKKKAKKE